LKIIKRDCSEVDFDKSKISTAILKAMKNGSGIVKPKIAEDIANEIEEECKNKEDVSISDIESMVYDKLITKKQRLTAKAYEGYRSIREFQRENENTTDIEIHDLVEDKDEYWKDENANKNPVLNPTKRDYIAGSVSTDMTKRYLLSPEIIQAHNEGLIHFHDADYFLQHMHNCFHGKTRFITSEGIKSFDEFSDGSSVRVLDKDGVWRNATVRTYGKNKMYEVTFTTAKMKKTVVCTSNHRWLLQNGEVTTNLKIGDRLLPITDITDKYTIESYHESNMFTLGFLIGDGCDHIGSNLHQVRLCGHKVEYSKYFESAGYKLTAINGTDDIIATKHGYIKQDFLNSKSWKYMSENDKRLLFLGLYAADGKINGNRLCTTDEREAELIEDISCFAGFYISSKSTEIRDTQYKENSEILVYHFITHQPNNLCWKVADIKPYHSTTEYLSWCVEEPITHSFTLEGGMITGNCGLVNSEDMLQNNTVISETLIETPHSFSTACNIETQAIAQIASNQYGGQSISLAHLAPFVDVSRKSIRKKVTEELYNNGLISEYNEDLAEVINITNKRLKEEIEKGVQTIQYQLVTLMTTNGQAPFITIFMYLNEAKNNQEKADLAMLIEEMLRQRIQGVKNEDGVYIAPAFPKLIYVLEEDNITEDSKYWYLTELAAKCTSKRLVPDYISEKMMLELKGDVYTCMGCRSFLTVDRFTDKVGNIANAKNFDPNKHKYYGRFNQGVVTISLPDIAFSSDGDFDKFWEIFEERTELCHKALRARHERLLGTSSDVAPILWQHGAYARLKKHEKIDRLLYDGYSTISLGYAGLYECVKFMTGHSHSDEGIGEEFGLKVMQALNDKCNQWKQAENIDYSLYGTPLESTTYKFAKCLKSRFGNDIFEKLDGFDRNYITNSYHIPVFEHITAFEKLRIESKFQKLSPGGAISYIEIPSMSHNISAILEVIKFIYNNIMYAEINTKSCYCEKCGFDGDIPLVSDENNRLKWECPSCGNTDNTTMDIAFRVCGYIGTAKNGGNQGRYGDIHDRVYHLDDMEYTED
jgi:ribonucleoside-triphosphate reductase